MDWVSAVRRAVRSIHLAAGLFALPFLAVYFASAVQMAHRSWWPVGQRVTEQVLLLPPGLDARAVARRLPLRGELSMVKLLPTGFDLLVRQPGRTYLVGYSPSSGEAHVRVTTSGVLGMLVALHRSRSFGHAYPPADAWVAALALVSLALLTMGATGLCLWFQNRAERWTGFVALAAGASLSVTLIVSMRMG